MPSEDDLLERWLAAVLATPGITALPDVATARARLVDDALRALPLIRETAGSVVDVGSGTGSPGLPIAASFPDRPFTLLDSSRRKCEFLQAFAADLPNVRVVRGRAEEQTPETHGVALAKALARPPVAAELTLPLVHAGGIAVLWCGPSADRARVSRVAARLAAEVESNAGGLLVLRKTGRTPPGFPRKPGIARKRPLA